MTETVIRKIGELEGENIIDMGSGSGTLLIPLAKKFPNRNRKATFRLSATGIGGRMPRETDYLE